MPWRWASVVALSSHISRKNAIIARDNRPSDFKGGIEKHFQEFLKTMKNLEMITWNKARFRELDNACSRCHERPQ